MKRSRNPADVHEPLAAYTHQIEISGPERLLMLSGQVGRRQDGSLPEDAGQQLDVALDNVLRNLQAARMGVTDIVKLTLYLVGNVDASTRGEILAKRLGGHRPCMTLVYVAALASPAYKVEVDAWASSDNTETANDQA